MSAKRKCLTLEERVKVIKLLESGKSSRIVADEVGVGRTQIQNVFKRKREILDEYENNCNRDKKRPRRATDYDEINDLCYKWFLDASSRHINVSGPLLKEKALKFASELGVETFKASNGWLDSFLKRNNIVFRIQSGERGEVDSDVVKNWKERIPSVCEGYAPSNIFNMDETGLFYRDTTKTTYFTKGETCSSGKRSKERITVALCASMTGKNFLHLKLFNLSVSSPCTPSPQSISHFCAPYPTQTSTKLPIIQQVKKCTRTPPPHHPVPPPYFIPYHSVVSVNVPTPPPLLCNGIKQQQSCPLPTARPPPSFFSCSYSLYFFLCTFCLTCDLLDMKICFRVPGRVRQLVRFQLVQNFSCVLKFIFRISIIIGGL